MFCKITFVLEEYNSFRTFKYISITNQFKIHSKFPSQLSEQISDRQKKHVYHTRTRKLCQFARKVVSSIESGVDTHPIVFSSILCTQGIHETDNKQMEATE